MSRTRSAARFDELRHSVLARIIDIESKKLRGVFNFSMMNHFHNVSNGTLELELVRLIDEIHSICPRWNLCISRCSDLQNSEMLPFQLFQTVQ